MENREKSITVKKWEKKRVRKRKKHKSKKWEREGNTKRKRNKTKMVWKDRFFSDNDLVLEFLAAERDNVSGLETKLSVNMINKNKRKSKTAEEKIR